MADHLGGHGAAQPAGLRQIPALRVGVKESGRVGVAGAGRVHDLDAGDSVDHVDLVA